jgi:outer membrane protein
VRLRHWQAAACVAMGLLTGLQPTWAQQATTSQLTIAPQQTTTAPQTGTTAQQPGQVNPTAPAQAAPVQNDTTGTPGLPQAPQPLVTQPLYLRPTDRDYTHAHNFLPNPILDYFPTDYPAPRLTNTPRLDQLLRDGKVYLSLSDAVTLALENNYDIEIARINLDIADTDILRAKAGSTLRGVSTGLVTNTLGGTTSTITGGGGPGGTTSATGGSGAGASGLVLSTNGGGPLPENMDPLLTGTAEYQSQTTPESSSFLTGTSTEAQNTTTYDAQYQQGFLTGTELTVGFNNTRVTTNSSRTDYNPTLNSNFSAQVTQHLLQGFGTFINGRFIIQAKNDRRITDSSFRQQIIYTVGQVESIYWALVSAYEDEQAKERALQQSTQLTADNRKQLEIGTLAPLDVVNSDSAVATDKQSLITSQTNLEYQQLLMKQAISRDLNDPQLANAPVVPTDRVGLDRLPEEDEPVEDLVREAYTNNPQVEQATLTMQNNQITIRAEKNGLLPVLDAFAFYGGSGLGGTVSPNCAANAVASGVAASTCPNSANYGSVLGSEFNNSNPNYGVGVNLSIPLRNRPAQADQMRSQMELRQSQIRLQQLYTQLRIQVINGKYALQNDRGSVLAADAGQGYAAQALEAEQKKYRLGASTTANVLQMERNLATAEDSLISAQAAYARDRSSLEQILAITLDRYGISLTDAARGMVSQAPHIPGLTAPKPPEAPKPLTANPAPMPQ